MILWLITHLLQLYITPTFIIKLNTIETMNMVYLVKFNNRKLIIRLRENNPYAKNEFMKEQWFSKQCSKIWIPITKIKENLDTYQLLSSFDKLRWSLTTENDEYINWYTKNARRTFQSFIKNIKTQER